MDKLNRIVDNSMKNSNNKKFSTLNTILTLAGIFAGAFLMTKLLHGKTGDTNLSNKIIEKPKSSKRIINTKINKRDIILDGLNNRQNNILVFLKEKGVVSPKDLQELVPGVSSRTLRRDMDALANKKYVLQKGNTKSTYYEYIKK